MKGGAGIFSNVLKDVTESTREVNQVNELKGSCEEIIQSLKIFLVLPRRQCSYLDNLYIYIIN